MPGGSAARPWDDCLRAYLPRQGGAPVTLSFEMVHSLRGRRLPLAAYARGWWASRRTGRYWRAAGWRVRAVRRGQWQVTFVHTPAAPWRAPTPAALVRG
jgi:hypothetical protein